MLVHSLVARNDAVESENKIHEDSVARQYGFAGGLVPGVTVFAYLTWPAVERWGIAWLDRGAIAARFAAPVYDGETVEIHCEGQDALQIEARNPNGEVCATATASLPDAPAAPFSAADFPTIAAPTPDTRPPASEDILRSVPLGVVERTWHAEKGADYLDVVSDDLTVYREPPVAAHPGWLLRAANTVLSNNVRLGPWIHVSSECQYHGRVTDGDVVTTMARVTDVFERRGHRFVALDVLMAVRERPVLAVRHTAIYEPRRL